MIRRLTSREKRDAECSWLVTIAETMPARSVRIFYEARRKADRSSDGLTTSARPLELGEPAVRGRQGGRPFDATAIEVRAIFRAGVLHDPAVAGGTKLRVQLGDRPIGKIDAKPRWSVPERPLFASADVDLGHAREREPSGCGAQLPAIERHRERPLRSALAVSRRGGIGTFGGIRHETMISRGRIELSALTLVYLGAPVVPQHRAQLVWITAPEPGMPLARDLAS